MSLLKSRNYLIYALIFFAFLFLSQNIIDALDNIRQKTFDYNLLYINTVTIFYILSGVLIGLEQFIRKSYEKGRWKVNIERLLIFGIPSLFFTYYMFLPISGLGQIASIRGFMQISTVTAILLGYIIVTSFYKDNLGTQ